MIQRNTFIQTGILFALTGCSQDISVTEKPAQFEVSPTSHDLGTVPVGEEISIPLQVSGLNGNVQILGVQVQNLVGNYCSYSGDLQTIESDTSVEVSIQYMPETDGLHQCLITVVADASPEEIDVMIFANAVSPNMQVYPRLLDFGVVESGETESLSVTVENSGALGREISNVVLDDARFTVTSNLPVTVDAGATATLTVAYTPTEMDVDDATLNIYTTDNTALPSVSLMGNNCELGIPSVYDVDEDGYTSCGGDCDDGDPSTAPNLPEICDGLDNNCDGIVDEGTECMDDDGDGYSENEGDCNDNDPNIFGEQTEIPSNGIDDNCDGIIDDESVDADGDGYSAIGGDCDDSDATISPVAPELVDNIDNDCNGLVDDGTTAYDDDGDGYSEVNGDCDDGNPLVAPGISEVANGIDDDCNTLVDDTTEVYDDDGDGYSELGGDCDDNDPMISPAAAEVLGDSVDDNCDGIVD
jgi:hypothetical protein